MAKLIVVKKGDQTLHVSEKAFRVVYSAYGYKKIGEVEETSKKEQTEEVDLYQLDRAELEKINKDVIQAFLDKEEIPYKAGAKKDELINIVLGEE